WCGDVKRDVVLAEHHPDGEPPLEVRAERVSGAGVGDLELRAVQPADDHHLLAVNRSLPDLRLKGAVMTQHLIIGQRVIPGVLGDGLSLEALPEKPGPRAGVTAVIGLFVAIAADDPRPDMLGRRDRGPADGRGASQAAVEARSHDVDALSGPKGC